jgi:hypothetical protein
MSSFVVVVVVGRSLQETHGNPGVAIPAIPGRLMQQDSIGFQAVSSMPKMRLQYMGGPPHLWKPSYHNDLQDDKP